MYNTKLVPKNILVIGDLMIDQYTYGKVKRISPEAPVPILHVEEQKELPGGAGNVMSNLSALGMKVFALGRVGADQAGGRCTQLLQRSAIDTKGILVDSTFETPVKHRAIANGQQLLRIDYEKKNLLSPELEEAAFSYVMKVLPQLDAITISDYDKGFCTHSLLQMIINEARKREIVVIADPKGNDFIKYKNATLLKPNYGEALSAAKLSEGSSLDKIAEVLFQETACSYLMITRSEAGLSLFSKEGRQDFPAEIQQVKDVTGAGDTVCAVTTAAFANRLSLTETASLANRAAGFAVQHVGCFAVTLKELV